MSDFMIDSLKNSNRKLFAILAGGGYSFISNFAISGTSHYFMGANVLSDTNMITELLGKQPAKYCSEDVAISFANIAYSKCLRANINSSEAFGVGVTCSLATDNERIGREHNVYIALRSEKTTIVNHIQLHGNSFSRTTEENLVNNAIKTLITDFTRNDFHDKDYVIYTDDYLQHCMRTTGSFKKLLIFPGAFNPLHEAHITMHNLAQKHVGLTCLLEITDNHPDKGLIGHKDLANRIRKIRDSLLPVVITSASTYLDKVSWYKQRCKDLESIVFVIGADTWDRIRDSVRYNGISQDMLYDFFSGNNVNFLVFNRHNKLTTDDKWDKLIIDCQDARLFNNSLSSTEIRVVV